MKPQRRQGNAGAKMEIVNQAVVVGVSVCVTVGALATGIVPIQ